MNLLHTIPQLREQVAAARRSGSIVGLVPTMGALHDGHLSLIRRARSECGFVVVSVFVNLTQFGPGEDLDRYPRDPEADVRACAEAGVDVVFAPDAGQMYPDGFDTWVEVGGPARVLEGVSRPGHFRGVATVCAKLFNIVGPDRAYFGRKDYQQLKVIEKMVRDLDMRLEIVPVDTVREPDGLAMSSRNVYLNADERRAATVIHQALSEAVAAFEAGERSAASVQDLAQNLINLEPLAELDYAAVVDAETLMPVDSLDLPAVLLLAVRIGGTRLIDNVVLQGGYGG